jgi:hypothetical protein
VGEFIPATHLPPQAEAVQVMRMPDQPWQTFEAETVAHLEGFRPVENVRTSRYGGLLRHRSIATGLFRMEKIRDRWLLIDPDGHSGARS